MGQQVRPPQVVDRRDDLAVGEVAGRPEQDEDRRVRHALQAQALAQDVLDRLGARGLRLPWRASRSSRIVRGASLGAARAGPGSAGPAALDRRSDALRTAPLRLRVGQASGSRPRRRHRRYSVLTAWPPNSLRSAARTLAAVRVVLAGAEAGQQRQGDDRRRDVVVDGFLDGPAALAGVRDVALEVLEVLAVGLERPAGQLEQPRADDGALHPQLGDRRRGRAS